MKTIRMCSTFLLLSVVSASVPAKVPVASHCTEFRDWTELDYFWPNFFGLRDEHYHNASDGPHASDLRGGGQWPDEGPRKLEATGLDHDYLKDGWTLESLEHTRCSMT